MKDYIQREHYILIALNALYIVPLVIKFTLEGNFEFLAYVGQVIFLLGLIMLTIHKTRFPMWLLVLLSLWSALHMAGGSVVVGDGVLYAYKFFHVVGGGDSYVLKYDQIVHFFGFFVATFVAYWLLLPQLKPNFRLGAIVFVAVLAGMGFGAINEIIEFIAVLAAPETGVGGYYNTAIDLVANALGALTAAFLIVKFKIGENATFT
jgi:putative membrane protein